MKKCYTNYEYFFQSLNLLSNELTDSDVHIIKVQEYIEATVCLLQLLSNFIKEVVETVTLSCCSMKIFPTTTGRIILTVFRHCKDRYVSTNIYYIFKSTTIGKLMYFSFTYGAKIGSNVGCCS